MAAHTQQLILSSRPDGDLTPACFDLVTTHPSDGYSLMLSPRFISVDPYMRTRMQPQGYDYIEHWQPGSVLSGWMIAQVASSRHPDWTRGDWAVGHLPMQGLIAHKGIDLYRFSDKAPPLAYLHPLGMTGFTAWIGMCQLGQPNDQDVVLVNAAAGAVGSLAAQFARLAGARVIVTAGREDKREWLRQLGFSEVLDHRAPDYAQRLANLVPQGITLNFENLGGVAFEAANTCMRPGGRVILCGLVSQYQQAQPRRVPSNFSLLQANEVSVTPFVTPHYYHLLNTFYAAVRPLVERNELVWKLDIIEGGLAAIPEALIGLLNGHNLGKRVVKI